MRTGRPKQPLMLTDEERERLESLAHRAESAPLQARRARGGAGLRRGTAIKAQPGNCAARWAWWANGAGDS